MSTVQRIDNGGTPPGSSERAFESAPSIMNNLRGSSFASSMAVDALPITPSEAAVPGRFEQNGARARSITTEALGHALACALPTVILLCLLALFVGTGNELTQTFKVYRKSHPLLIEFVKLITAYGTIAFHIPSACLLWRAVRTKNRAEIKSLLTYLAAQIVVSLIFVRIIKIVTGTPRPLVALKGETSRLFTLDNKFNSFPSGHTVEAMGAGGMLSMWFKSKKVTLACGLWIACIAFSRIFLCQHSITDVLAGLLIGSITVFIVNYYSRRNET